jgi:hypothetical protein
MARVLAMAERIVAPDGRDQYLGTLAERRAAAAAVGVHFWVFEAADAPGRYVEFAEAPTAEAIRLMAGPSIALWHQVGGD